MRYPFLCAFAAFLSLMNSSLNAQDYITLTDKETTSLCKTVNRKEVSVHDPSVVQSSKTSKTFYIAGTMRGWARSTDNMRNWTSLDNSKLFGVLNSSGKAVVADFNDAFSTNATTKVPALVNNEVQEVPFGNFDAKAWANADQSDWSLDGNMWAPDIIFNPNSGKWMMYYSINGDDWHSVIVLLTATSITGPYVYQGPVHYSGFINTTNPVISYKKTDLEIAIGEQATLPDRYNKGKQWGQYWTNDIDPCVFFDEEGELWMTYGSWSGGIFILKMDKQTGLRDYTVTYPYETDASGRALSDPYFGKRIAGGYYSSGEGSYIQHIGDYYYLFMSYGGFAPNGGYEMRTFRSTTPDGQYVDAGNLDACFHNRGWTPVGTNADTNGGMKLLGSYNGWGLQTVGECAQGHNSATSDKNGRNFVVYHTKFNNGTDGHLVRTRQLFLNESGWLCAAPFQFDDETVTDASLKEGCEFTADEMVGSYKVLIHKYKMNFAEMEEVKPVTINLLADGKVTGNKTGTWTMTPGTGYITLTLGGVNYQGVVVPQTVDGTNIPAIGITATAVAGSSCGVQLWAYRIDPKYAVAYTAQMNTALMGAAALKDGDIVRQNLTLPTNAYLGAKIEWTTSDASAITSKGVYRSPEESKEVTLTCKVTCEDVMYTRTFNLTAAAVGDLPEGDYLTDCVAYYPFTTKATGNQFDKTQKPTFKALGDGKTPVIENDSQRGKVLHQYYGGNSTASYTLMNNPLNGLDDLKGMTVAMWLNMDGSNEWDAIWSFANDEANDATARLFMTGNAYVGYNDGSTFFDVNNPNSGVTGYLPVNKWSFVVMTLSSSGVSIYVDGVKKAQKSFAGSQAYNAALAMVRTAPYMQLGMGSFWGSAACYIDDLLVYKRALTVNDVSLLNIMANRSGTDYTAIPEVSDTSSDFDTRSFKGVYDFSGRRVGNELTRMKKGLYIVNGRKVLIK